MLIEKQYEPVLPNGWYEAMAISYKDRDVKGTLVTDLEWQVISGDYKDQKVRQSFWHDANSASIRTLTRLYDAVIDSKAPSIDPRAFLDKIAHFKVKKVSMKDGGERNFVIDASLKKPGTIERIPNPIVPTPSMLETRAVENPAVATTLAQAVPMQPARVQNVSTQQGAVQSQVVQTMQPVQQAQGVAPQAQQQGIPAPQQSPSDNPLPEDQIPF